MFLFSLFVSVAIAARMFRLASEFHQLPLRFDAARLAAECLQFSEEEWRAHPSGHVDNSSLPLITVGGGMNDEVKGQMRPTPFLERCPYIRQVLASLGSPLGRARLMRIAGESDAHEHVDTNYYWMHHVRVHFPAVTYPEVRFLCGDKSVHMAAGEAWIFDSWRLHNVINPVSAPRIHIVADTVGSAEFWEMATGGERAAREVGYVEDAELALFFEEENYPLVMTPFEQRLMGDRMFADLPPGVDVTGLRGEFDALNHEWHALWTTFRDAPEGWDAFRALIARFDKAIAAHAGTLRLVNTVPLAEALRQAVVRPAVNVEVAKKNGAAPKAVAAKPTVRAVEPVVTAQPPVFIIAAPRSGSTMLFELLARSPDAATVGGESHEVFESIPALHPANRDWHSNRLTAADATPDVVAALRTNFTTRLRDRDGNAAPATARLLEKTPKNALRIPFLAAAFPNARFIFLTRDARENVSSILDAWRSQLFVTYNELPGWERGEKWSLALVPGWRDFMDLPLAEVAARQLRAINERALDDLAALPQERWTLVTYDEVLADPNATAARLCKFAGLRWTDHVTELPPSRHTLTPPSPDKWRRNEAEMSPFLPLAESVAGRIAALQSSPQQPAVPPPADQAVDEQAAPDFSSEHTNTFAQILAELGCSVAVSTYQAGKLILLREKDGVVNTHFRDFASPMGLAYSEGWLALGTRNDVWKFRGFPGEALRNAAPHDCVFLPGGTHTTGDIRIHEVAWSGHELWAVNTRFSCLCTFDGVHSFIPRWKPPFITALAAEDRCHLNGLAMNNGVPAFVTMHAAADTPEGWRDVKKDGGIIMDVATGEVVASGLAMPHSPRIYDGKLWVLESGLGRLSIVDVVTGEVQPVAEFPGFTRGLDFAAPFAFVGLSQVRETAVFSGIPIADAPERNCGVWVLDLRTMQTVAFVRFSGSVQEIFSVCVLPGMSFPDLLTEGDEMIGGAFLIPGT